MSPAVSSGRSGSRSSPEKLSYYGLTISSLQNAVQSENQNTSGGAIRLGNGRFQLRVPGEFNTPEEIYGLVIGIHQGRAGLSQGCGPGGRRLQGGDQLLPPGRPRCGQSGGQKTLRRKHHRHQPGGRHDHRRSASAHWPSRHRDHQGHGQGQGYRGDGGRPGEQYSLRPGPGAGGHLFCHGHPQRHSGEPGHPLFHAALLYRPLCHGHHPEHGGPFQPDPGPGHAGRQCHRHRRKLSTASWSRAPAGSRRP